MKPFINNNYKYATNSEIFRTEGPSLENFPIFLKFVKVLIKQKLNCYFLLTFFNNFALHTKYIEIEYRSYLYLIRETVYHAMDLISHK